MALVGFLLGVVQFVLYLPIRILLALRFSPIFTLSGFFLGTLGGLVAGYFAFIYPEPSDFTEVEITSIADEDKELTLEEKKRFYRLLPPWVHTPDVERIGWMNKMVAIMWPFIDKAVCAEVIAQATPIIEASKPSFVEAIDFDTMTLGTLPPAIVGIKSFQTLEDEVIIQPQLRWIARPNVKVLVRVFGMTLTAHLTHFFMEAPVRITLKPLSNYFPCFSKIVLTLMSPPQVDLGLSLLGLDFLVIPAVDRIVAAQVESALADMLIWPVTMTIYEEDPLPVKGKLYIRDIEARNLRNVAGLVSKIDPFVRVGFGRKVGNFQTKAEKDTSSPEWKLEGVVGVHDKEEEVLLVEGFHQKKPKNVLIGLAQFSLKELSDGVEHLVENLSLQRELPVAGEGAGDMKRSATRSKDDCGTITFKLTYVPRKVQEGGDGEAGEEEDEIVIPNDVPVGGGLLWVKLRSARDLESKKAGYVHPIIHLKFRGREEKSLKYQETDIELFDDPPFTWECPRLDKDRKDEKEREKEARGERDRVAKESLHVKVVAETKGASLTTVTNPMALKRLLQSHDTVGYVDIPLRDVVANGRTLDDYALVGSKGASLKIELRWAEKKPEAAPAPVPEPTKG